MFLVRLHVIQFTRYSVKFFSKLSLAANFYMLAHRFQFVKNFFQVFSNFFSIRAQSCRSRDSFRIIPLHNRFVNTFFKGNYFYFEFLLQWHHFHGFPAVPACSWPLCPGSYSFIHALRRGPLYLWTFWTRCWIAGYGDLEFMRRYSDAALPVDPGGTVLWFSILFFSYYCEMEGRLFLVPVDIHTFVCILMHGWRGKWRVDRRWRMNFFLEFWFYAKTKKTVLLEYGWRARLKSTVEGSMYHI